jgi:hypothetical protein
MLEEVRGGGPISLGHDTPVIRLRSDGRVAQGETLLLDYDRPVVVDERRMSLSCALVAMRRGG